MADGVEIGVYIPQVGFTFEQYLARAQLCERLGIASLWMMDHLYPPEMPEVPSLEAWTLATAVLARTERLRVGHLVLSATFRPPALLGKMATSLDHVSGGRFELGLGSGSYEPEHRAAGLPWGTVRERTDRLEASLEVISAMFGRAVPSGAVGPPVPPNVPKPLRPGGPRIHVGGAGERRLLPLAARYADVWNCPTYAVGAFEEKCSQVRALAESFGRDRSALRCSVEAVLVLVDREERLAEAKAVAERRFGGPGWGLAAGDFVGTPARILDRIEAFRAQGADSFVFFLHDRGDESTLRLLADEVLSRLPSQASVATP